MSLRFLHILGHQDTRNKKKPLTLEARLNIECDAAATKLHSQLTPNQYPQQHPYIPDTHPYLNVRGNHIKQNTQQTLRDAYTTIEYNKYLTKKYKWTPAVYNHTEWRIMRIAIN